MPIPYTTSTVRVDLARQRREIERIRADLSSRPRDERRVTTRATARILDNVHLEGRMGRFVVESDEPAARGGECDRDGACQSDNTCHAAFGRG